MRRRLRIDPLRASVAIACIMHMMVFALLPRPPSRRPATDAALAPARLDELAVIEVQSPEALADDEAAAATPRVEAAGARSAARASSSGALAMARTAKATESAAVEPRTPSDTGEVGRAQRRAQSADGAWSFSATADHTVQRDILGSTARALAPLAAGERAASERAPAPPEGRDRPRPSPGGLVEALDAHDRELGLGRGGPVLSAIEEAVRIPGETPPEGSADYEVIVRRSGHVAASVLVASSERASWEGLLREIERQVMERRVSLPSSASGMRFVVHVDAVVQWPDGKRPAKTGTRGVATTGEVGASEAHAGLSFTRVPMLGVYHSGKVCSAGVALAPGMLVLGGACSPENAGQVAARIVHGRIVRESRL